MKTVKRIFAAVLLLFWGVLIAQQESSSAFYKYHMNMVNPAYAGVNDQTLFTASTRKQWIGIKGEPETHVLSFGTNVGSNLGLGISMVSDRTFIEKQTMLGIDFSYKVKMSETADLYLGIKAGGNFYDINASSLETYFPQSDPALLNINHFNPNAGVGALLRQEKYFISLSVPRMLNTKRSKESEGTAIMATDKPHVYLSMGCDLDLNSEASLVLKPSMMLRYVNNAPVSLDVNAMLEIQKNFEIGTTYRNDGFFVGLVDLTISKRLMIGYAYEVSTRQGFSGKNTNEFVGRFKF